MKKIFKNYRLLVLFLIIIILIILTIVRKQKMNNDTLNVENQNPKTKKKSSDSKASIDSLKVTKKGDTATISLKILADESITKKALTELFTDAAAEAFKQIK